MLADQSFRRVANRSKNGASYLHLTAVFKEPQLLPLIPLQRGSATEEKFEHRALPSQVHKRPSCRYRVVEVDLPGGFRIRVSQRETSQCPTFE